MNGNRRSSAYRPGGLLARLTITASIAAYLMPLPAGAAEDPVIMAAGDIACSPAKPAFKGGNGTATKCRQKFTAALLEDADVVLPLGDTQYDNGALSDFGKSYALSWGAPEIKAKTRPIPGDNEYNTSNGTGYFAYFGASAGDPGKGYYAWGEGAWRLIALNSSISMASGSAQYTWLRNELTTHSNLCVAAYWHEPRFKSGKDNVNKFAAIWQLLYDHDADVVLNGHAHSYQRFAPLDPSGRINRDRGVREFIVGTGGVGFSAIPTTGDARVEKKQDSTYGVLQLTLHPGSYDWQFLAESDKPFTDSGTTNCH